MTELAAALHRIVALGFTTDYPIPETHHSKVVEALQGHLQSTWPQSPKDHVGIEHFWAIGEQGGYSIKPTSSLYTALIFPLAKPHNGELGGTLSREDDLGLHVATRETIGFQPLPRGTTTRPHPSHGQRAHTQDSGPMLDSTDYVMQVEGLLTLSSHPETLERIDGIGKGRREALDFIARSLVEEVGISESDF